MYNGCMYDSVTTAIGVSDAYLHITNCYFVFPYVRIIKQ